MVQVTGAIRSTATVCRIVHQASLELELIGNSLYLRRGRRIALMLSEDGPE